MKRIVTKWSRIAVILALSVLLGTIAYAQSQQRPSSSGKIDDSNVREDEGASNTELLRTKLLEDFQQSKPYKRQEWFYGQRGLHLDNMDGHKYFELLNTEILKENARARTRSMGGDQFLTAPGSLSWSNIGPNGIDAKPGMNGDQWGVVSGRIRAMAIHPTNANVVYAGAAAGGLWKTTNGGSTWADIGASLASLTYGAIAIDPNNTNTIYAGGGEIRMNLGPWIYNGGGLYKSTNAGSTWTNITNGFGTQTHFGAIVVNPQNSNEVFAALGSGYLYLDNLTNEGIWKSTNAGTTWSRVLNEQDAFDVWMHPTTSGTVYAAIGGGHTDSGVHESTDGGTTWTKISTGLPTGAQIERIQVAQSPSHPDTMYSIIYGTFSATYKTTLWKTTDGGASWSQISSGVQLGGNYGSGWRDQGSYDLCVAVHPTDPDLLMTGNIELFRATDGANMGIMHVGGSTAWNSPCHVDYHIIRFSASSPSTAYLGCDGGIFKSTDAGATWSDVNNNISTIQFYNLASHPIRQDVLFGGAQDNGNFRTLDGGATAWEGVTTGDGMYCLVDRGDTSVVYMSTQYGNHMKSTDGGSDFVDMVYTAGFWNSPLVMHPHDSRTLYAFNTSVRKSTDAGANWSTVAGGAASYDITTFDVSPVNPAHMIFAAHPLWNNFLQVKVSSDSGSTWTTVTANIGGTTRFVPRVVCDPLDANTMYLTKSGFVSGEKVYMTTDLGATWTNMTGDLPNVPANDLIVDPVFPGEYYVSTDLGVYHTTNGGTNWTREGAGMPYVPVIDLELVDYGSVRYLRAGSHGRSAFQAELDTCSGPLVTTQPLDASDLCDNTPVTLVAIASSNPAPTVQWQRSTNAGVTWNAIGSATSTSYSFVFSLSDDGNMYRAVFTNSCGTATSSSATVTKDATPPVITCPADITLSNDPGQCGAVHSYSVTASDNCPVGLSVTRVGLPSGSLFPVGTSVVTHTATDLAGNASQCSFTVTVNDTEPPTLVVPPDITQNSDPGRCDARVFLGPASASDNCPGVTLSNDAPPLFPVGTTTVTWTVMDASGNTATGIQLVTVVDVEPPTITPPPALVVGNDPGLCGRALATTSLGTPLTADNCGVQSVMHDAPAFFPVGLTVVTWTVTDIHGNTATATQNVTIEDREPPSITAPQAINGISDSWRCGTSNVYLGTPQVDDNCGVFNYWNDAPAFYPLGITMVTWTVQDVHGNLSSALQQVEVFDRTPPTMWVIMWPQFLTPATQTMRTIRTYLGVSDNCGTPTWMLESVTSSQPDAGTWPRDIPGDINAMTGQQTTLFSLRAESTPGKPSRFYTVRYRATDGSGNSTLYQNLVTVVAVTKDMIFTDDSQIPETIELGQNYPNPFTGLTSMTFRLPREMEISLRVYDALGREVAVVTAGRHGAGSHALEFDASALPEGVYLYKLISPEGSKTRKMLVIH